MTFRSNYMLPTCLITGCCLNDGGSYIHGDLHAFGSVFIFNACINENGEANRVYGGEPSSDKIVSCENSFVFERRAVIIFPIASARFNQAAKEYLDGQ